MAGFKIGNIIPSVGNIKAGSTDVIRIMNGNIQVWPLSVYQFSVSLGSAYCNSGVCYLDGTITNQILYLPPGAEPTVGGYLYEDPELTIPFVTNQIISTYNMLLLTFPTGELSLLCMEGSACPE